ncbi:hypothetical protein [Abyssogena phaseoliformis symbiont]|uniref:hypothetical protein n=1 Tax=Abyssogena phaseoliformis symbiont TaxID=596095 RepID=UPI001914F1E7|nr:hypothetical protein [Abyssogena phaseoliformis symbiont]
MKLPSLKKEYTLVVGTVLHNDELLPYLSTRKDFVSFDFPPVRKFPDDTDMLNP